MRWDMRWSDLSDKVDFQLYLCVQPTAMRMVGGTVYAHSGRLPDKQRVKVAKFCESFWKVVTPA